MIGYLQFGVCDTYKSWSYIWNALKQIKQICNSVLKQPIIFSFMPNKLPRHCTGFEKIKFIKFSEISNINKE